VSKVIKPLLATKAEFDKIQYPVLATPKLDGIRCLMVDGVAMSRSMKPIPNQYVQEQLKGLHGLDGELMINGDFNSVMSGIMSQDGEPDFTFHVFDSFTAEGGYEERLGDKSMSDAEWWRLQVQVLYPTEISNEKELLVYLEDCLTKGYEGVMIRQPDGRYKFGRSTVKEGILLKIKKFFDDEAELLEIIEAQHNLNEQDYDELGYSKRSSCKENLVPAGTAGSLVVKWNNKEFRVGFGPGFTDEKKQWIWDHSCYLIGQLVKFSYQELSKDGIPRFGKMLEIRHPDDL
jgi:DNA ligase 1